jgi:death-on-curing protein
MPDPVWLDRQILELLHGESLADHGGLAGLRSEALLDAAMMRPLNLHAYDGVTNIATLAACYAVALSQNHPFMDGNKRAAFIAMLVFADINGMRIDASQAEAAMVILDLAAGDLTQDELAAWLRLNARP